jgi:UDP-N-acetylglucosamine 2-epimerase (non-hydrolysing)
MLDQVLGFFGIEPDMDLKLMKPNQSLTSFAATALAEIGAYLLTERPDMIIAQGDTTTVFCAALAAFYQNIPVAHVEAGLRTGNLSEPWPEEANRVLTSRLVSLHFAPTAAARKNLINEGVPSVQISVTGNTVIDTLFWTLRRVRLEPPRILGLPEMLQPHSQPDEAAPRIVLITGHRRENFGEGFESICKAIATLACAFPNVHFVYPVHLNPNVREPVLRILGNSEHREKLENIHLLEPAAYHEFVALMNRSMLILTDSGGVQEEAPSLGKPVLVMRNTTERPEAVHAGTTKLVGTTTEKIVSGVSGLLNDAAAYGAMSRVSNPYGDGKASERIVEGCIRFFNGLPLENGAIAREGMAEQSLQSV